MYFALMFSYGTELLALHRAHGRTYLILYTVRHKALQVQRSCESHLPGWPILASLLHSLLVSLDEMNPAPGFGFPCWLTPV